jgi:LysR family transcriptional regulator, glycine cleavage system transcriptional activator
MLARTQKLRALLGPLRVFDAVCRAGGVSRAAEALHVTPGAISQQIKQLESGLGVPLFKKAGREVELTEVGEQLARRVADAFDRLDDALTDVGDPHAGRRLRLKVTPTLAIRWLVPRLSGFYAQHPQIDLEIATIGRPDDIRLEGADCAVWHGVGEWTDVEFDHLFDDELIPLCSPALAAGLKSPQDLLHANLLHSMLRPEAWDLWFASLGLADEPRSRGLTLANAALCYQAAADGLGIAMAQRAYLGEELRSGRLVVPVEHVLTTEKGYYLVVDPLKADATPVRLFREWLRSVR